MRTLGKTKSKFYLLKKEDIAKTIKILKTNIITQSYNFLAIGLTIENESNKNGKNVLDFGRIPNLFVFDSIRNSSVHTCEINSCTTFCGALKPE